MLTLPCTPRQLIEDCIEPALRLFPVGYDSPQARCMLVAIAKQESDLRHARQINGPARGPWQFERLGVLGVLQSPKVDDLALLACREAKLAAQATLVHKRLEFDFLLAARIARLNLWIDPHALPMPVPASEGLAWNLYLRTWRPGAAKDPASDRYADARRRWRGSWQTAVEAVAHD